MNILKKIINDKHEEVRLDKINTPFTELKKKVSNKNNAFSKSLDKFKKNNKNILSYEVILGHAWKIRNVEEHVIRLMKK